MELYEFKLDDLEKRYYELLIKTLKGEELEEELEAFKKILQDRRDGKK